MRADAPSRPHVRDAAATAAMIIGAAPPPHACPRADPVPHRASDLALRLAIESAIERVFGIDHAELFKKSRGRAPTALARQVAMYLANVACGLSFTDVGRLFGRDRTTVAHACAVVEDRRDEESFDRAIELLEWVVPTLASPHLRFPETHR